MPSRRNKTFAAALDAAMKEHNVDVHDLSRELRRRGHVVSTHKISNWRRGQSLPRLAATQKTIEEIEKILGIDTSLRAALRADLLAEQADAQTDAQADADIATTEPHNRDYDVNKAFSATDDSIDWDGEVYREAMDEEIIMSADFRTVRMKVSLVVRYKSNSSPTLHVASFWHVGETPLENEIGLYEIEGAEIAQVHTETLPDGISTITELRLPTGTSGEIRRICYEQGYTSPTPLHASAARAFSWPIVYSGRVIFEGEVPQNIRWVATQTHSNEVDRTVRALQLTPNENVVQHSMEAISNSSASFLWDAPSP